MKRIITLPTYCSNSDGQICVLSLYVNRIVEKVAVDEKLSQDYRKDRRQEISHEVMKAIKGQVKLVRKTTMDVMKEARMSRWITRDALVKTMASNLLKHGSVFITHMYPHIV